MTPEERGQEPDADAPPPDAGTSSASADAAPPLYCWRFGNAEFDEARNELRVGGLLVELQPKPLQLLALMLATPGKVVAKDKLLDRVWAQRATGDAVLANAISKLRNALGDDNAGRIVTVPRLGYRFDGEVERRVVGHQAKTAARLEAGDAVPGRPGYRLQTPLNGAREVWLAAQPKTGDRRVFKFASDGQRLADLKREVTVQRLLLEQLGERNDIARVLDWNFAQAPCWIECEYAGLPLDAWAAQPKGDAAGQAPTTHRLDALPQAERLALWLQVADAVAAAHGAGVLHKDLKPANILVARLGAGGWQLRLADFGSARLLDPAQLDRLRITRLGLTVDEAGATSGTPYYIAPELLAGQPPSMASDVYALGVMLYQLLAGALGRPLAPGWERDIDDELLRQDIAAATDQQPRHRLSSAALLAQRVRELPQRRAQQASAQAAAERAAADQAALARSRAQRPWRLAALATLAAGTALSTWLYIDQRQSAAGLAREVAATQALNRLLREDLIAAANPGLDGRADITVADALRGAAARIDAKYAALPAAQRGRLHAAMQQALAELSLAKEAAEAGRRAVALLADAPGELAALQNARLRLAVDLVQLSQLDQAATVVRAIEAAPPPPGTDAAVFRARLLFAKSWLTGGDLSLQQSLAQLQEAASLVEKRSEEEAPGRGAILFGLADNLSMLGRLAEAEGVYRRLLAEQQTRWGRDHARPLYTQVGLARVLGLQGKGAEARTLLQEAAHGLQARLGAGHRHTLTARDQLAELLLREGRFDDAATEWAAVQQGFAALMGAGSSYVITVQTNRGLALHGGKHLNAAADTLRDALARARALLPDEAPQVQQIRYALADCLADLGQSASLAEAATLSLGLQPAALNLAQQEPDWPARLQRLQDRLNKRPKPRGA